MTKKERVKLIEEYVVINGVTIIPPDVNREFLAFEEQSRWFWPDVPTNHMITEDEE